MGKVVKIVNIDPPKTFCAIDASTNSLAFCIFEGGKVKKYGKIKFYGANVFEKIEDIVKKTKAFFDANPIETIIIEDTIYINSHSTASMLAKTQGALIGGAFLAGVKEVYAVSPVAWQSYIGTRLLTTGEKAELKKLFPGKSSAWYKAKERETRKLKTMDTINKRFRLDIDDDDIADSVGIGIYAGENWGKLKNGKR